MKEKHVKVEITLTNDQAIDMLKNYLAFMNQVSIDDISVSIIGSKNNEFCNKYEHCNPNLSMY